MHPQPTEQQTRQIKARYLTAGMAVLRPLSATPLIASLVRREGDTVLVSFAGVAGEGSYYVEEAVTVAEQPWYFTFGSAQQHDGKYVVISGSHDGARDEMFRYFGTAWAFQYSTAGAAGVEEFGLVELPRAEWPKPVVTEHRHVAGSGGVPGQCSAECSCGLTYDGFDTIAEAVALLDRHIAQENGTEPPLAATPELAEPTYMSCPRECGVDVRKHNSSDLIGGQCDTDAIAYRATFDELSGVGPLTIPASATTAEIAAKVAEAFDEAVEIDVKVRIDLTTGGVTIANEDGDIFERGRIEGPGIPEQPKPDYWLNLADDLRQVADRVATLAGTSRKPEYVSFGIQIAGPGNTDRSVTEVVDVVVKAFGAEAKTERTVTGRHEHRATAGFGDIRCQVYAYVPAPPELDDPEKAAMRAELDALRAQLAEGGATR